MISDFPKSIILDFDGVILDSSEIKTEVFQEFYKGFPDVFDEIMAFHIKHKGISRYEQFKYLCKLLNIDDPADSVTRFAAEFSDSERKPSQRIYLLAETGKDLELY